LNFSTGTAEFNSRNGLQIIETLTKKNTSFEKSNHLKMSNTKTGVYLKYNSINQLDISEIYLIVMKESLFDEMNNLNFKPNSFMLSTIFRTADKVTIEKDLNISLIFNKTNVFNKESINNLFI
jgi:hypothetical protein